MGLFIPNEAMTPLSERPGQEDERPVQRGGGRVLHHGDRARPQLHALHVLRRVPRRPRLEVRLRGRVPRQDQRELLCLAVARSASYHCLPYSEY